MATKEDTERWIARATEAAKQVHERPASIYEWAMSCTDEERAFFMSVYENRLVAGSRNPDGNFPRYVQRADLPGFHTLSTDAQYMVQTACERIWYRQQ